MAATATPTRGRAATCNAILDATSENILTQPIWKPMGKASKEALMRHPQTAQKEKRSNGLKQSQKPPKPSIKAKQGTPT